MSVRSGVKQVLYWVDVIAFLVIWGLAVNYGAHTWAWFVGLGVSAVSFVLWVVARLQLGQSFMLGVQARELVSRGLYSRFRHPIYLFGGLAVSGALLALQKWVVLGISILLMLPLQLVRIRRENRVLEASFGQAYRDYRSKTWL